MREELKRRATRTAIGSMILLAFVYGLVFVPTSVQQYVANQFDLASRALAAVGLSAGAGVIVAAIGGFMSGQDLLATGRSKAAVFFRQWYPSAYVIDTLRCTPNEANELWFSHIFNGWSLETHPQHEMYLHTFKRGYACRMIFTVQRALIVFIMASAATWTAAALSGLDASNRAMLFTRILALAIAVGSAIYLYRLNTLNPPTGCWVRWQEINGIHRAWLDHEVFDLVPAKHYATVRVLVTDPTWRHNHGYER